MAGLVRLSDLIDASGDRYLAASEWHFLSSIDIAFANATDDDGFAVGFNFEELMNDVYGFAGPNMMAQFDFRIVCLNLHTATAARKIYADILNAENLIPSAADIAQGVYRIELDGSPAQSNYTSSAQTTIEMVARDIDEAQPEEGHNAILNICNSSDLNGVSPYGWAVQSKPGSLGASDPIISVYSGYSPLDGVRGVVFHTEFYDTDLTGRLLLYCRSNANLEQAAGAVI